MDIIYAIRELCRGEHGFENMFDKAKSQGKLSQLTGLPLKERLKWFIFRISPKLEKLLLNMK